MCSIVRKLFVAMSIILFGCMNQNITDQADPTELRAKIRNINDRIESAMIEESISQLMAVYNEQINFMPEYKPAIFSRSSLAEFYENWWEGTDITAYKKQVHEILFFTGFALETGTFQMKYATDSSSEREYNGKYMVLWKVEKDKPSIVSEIFGADTYLEPHDIP